MRNRVILVLSTVLALLSEPSLGVEGVEPEPRISLPCPLLREGSPVEEGYLPPRQKLEGVLSGAYTEAGGYRASLLGILRHGSVSPRLALSLSEGDDVGSYLTGDGTARVQFFRDIWEVELWGRGYRKQRTYGEVKQTGDALGGGFGYGVESASYTLRGVVYGFDYLLEDGIASADGDLIGISEDLDVFLGSRLILRVASHFRRESLFSPEFAGATGLVCQILVTPALYLTPGVKANGDGSYVGPSLELRYLLSKRCNVSFALGPNYLSQSLAEVYLSQDYFWLKPQLLTQIDRSSLKAELTYRFGASNSFLLSGRRRKLENFVYWQNGDGDLLEPFNGEAEVRELELELEHKLPWLENTFRLVGRTVKDLDGSPIPYQPDAEFKERSELNLFRDWRFALEMLYCGRRRYRTTVRDELDYYYTSSVYGERKLGRFFSLFARVDNLGDSKHEVYKGYFHQGRIWSGGAKLAF